MALATVNGTTKKLDSTPSKSPKGDPKPHYKGHSRIAQSRDRNTTHISLWCKMTDGCVDGWMERCMVNGGKEGEKNGEGPDGGAEGQKSGSKEGTRMWNAALGSRVLRCPGKEGGWCDLGMLTRLPSMAHSGHPLHSTTRAAGLMTPALLRQVDPAARTNRQQACMWQGRHRTRNWPGP